MEGDAPAEPQISPKAIPFPIQNDPLWGAGILPAEMVYNVGIDAM